MKLRYQLDIALSLETRRFSVAFLPCDPWSWGRSDGLADWPMYSFGCVHLVWKRARKPAAA